MREYDVCVLGGGPAGSTAARELARLGHKVCLVEEQRKGSKMVGESLGASIALVLEKLGLLSAVEEAGFLRCGGARVRWARERAEELPHHAGGFLIDRGRFDQLLQQQAESSGAHLIRPGRATVRCINEDEIRVTVENLETGWSRAVCAAFVIDATGRRSILGGKRTRLTAQTVALCGHWRGNGQLKAHTLVEAAPWGWAWGAPLPGSIFSAITFSDAPDRKGQPIESASERYQRLLSSLELFRECGGAKLVSRVKVCDASTHFVAEAIGSRWAKIGEAAFTVDPLSSQGVQAAIRSGVQAAIVVNTVLRKPERRQIAQSFFKERIAEVVKRDVRTAAAMYAGCVRFASETFWRRRAADSTRTNIPPGAKRRSPTPPPPSCKVRISRQASLVKTPAVKGEFIEAVEAIFHPSLERAVAYLADFEVAPLLLCAKQPLALGEMLRAWEKTIPTPVAVSMIQWMWKQGILVPEDNSLYESPAVLQPAP